MQNFGRGMWRRVGDYERIQKPTLLQNSKLQQWGQLGQFVQYQTMLKHQKLRDEYLAQKKKETQSVLKVIEEPIQNKKVEEDSQEEDGIVNNAISYIPVVEQNLRELPVVIPKKTKKKNNSQ